jgi:hypothetical protein
MIVAEGLTMPLKDALINPCEPIVLMNAPIDPKRSLRFKKPLVFQPYADLENGGLKVYDPPLFIAWGEDREDLIQELQSRIADVWLVYGNNPDGAVGINAQKHKKYLRSLMEEVPNASRFHKGHSRIEK